MLLTAAGMAISTFAGAMAGVHPIAIAFVTALWAFAYGLIASLGQAATIVAQNSVLALVIFSAYAFTPAEAAVQATLLFFGGLFQMLLLVGVWPLQRFSKERAAVAAVYRYLAGYARKLPTQNLAPPDVALFQKAQAVLSDPQPFSHRNERAYYWNLYAEAERIREQLAKVAAQGIPATGTAQILEEIACALEEGRPAKSMPEAFAQVREQRLAGQLRSAMHVAQLPDEADTSREMRRQRVFSRQAIADAYLTIRGNIRWDSAYLQHALRLAVALFIAVAGERYLHLERGYWAPMTALLVLRPDFTTTFSRGVQRLSGTLAGAVLATLMIAVLHPSPALGVVLIVLFAFLGYLVIVLNYAVYTITVTAYVVFLLALAGLPSHNAVVDRIMATLFGGALGLLCYAIFPTWERSRVPSALADLMQAHGRYVECMLRVLAGTGTCDAAELNKLQSDVWTKRTAADASVDRMVIEPVRPRKIDAQTALAIMAASRRLGLAALSIRASVKDDAGRYPQLAALAVQFDVACRLLAGAIREQRMPEPLPPLREMQQQLPPEIPIARDTDLLVDALNTIADLLSKNSL